ncbi:hypothetical protein [Chromatium okenii]|uniref:hypothetical protein n=1 Tax=Chromatium okenii TaxID=61644 RepID=UPI001F5B1B8B|nr:hypothetical protein [Chromatium okenii]
MRQPRVYNNGFAAKPWDKAGFRTEFVARSGERQLSLLLHLAGAHNVRNALAATLRRWRSALMTPRFMTV